jgi:hypothetical protein
MPGPIFCSEWRIVANSVWVTTSVLDVDSIAMSGMLASTAVLRVAAKRCNLLAHMIIVLVARRLGL